MTQPLIPEAIKIHVRPKRRWFTPRGQWTFTIVASNGEPVDPRDSYFNAGDIRSSMVDLVATYGPPVQLVTHYRDGSTSVEQLR